VATGSQIRAKRLDQSVRLAWRQKHGFVGADGRPLRRTLWDDISAWVEDPCPDQGYVGVLFGLATGALEELQAVMYLGREACTGNRWVARNWARLEREDIWPEAFAVFGALNRGDRDALIRKIDEKAPLEHYLQAALARLPIDEAWVPVLLEMDPMPPSAGGPNGDLEDWDRTLA